MLTKEKLQKMYKSGLSLDKISKKENLSRAGVQYWMKRFNIPTRPSYESGFYGYWGASKSHLLPKKLTVEDIDELYFKQDLSAEDIAKMFNRTAAGVYRFMKRNKLPRRSGYETNNRKYDKKEVSFVIKKILTLSEKKLKIAGVMIYWAEGFKATEHVIDLANSDPRMVTLFMKFLRIICGIKEDKLRVQLYCYANQNVDSLKKYWSELTKIPLSQFIKPYIRKDFNIRKTNKMKYGLVHIRYCDKKLLQQIKNWIEEYIKNIG